MIGAIGNEWHRALDEIQATILHRLWIKTVDKGQGHEGASFNEPRLARID